MAISENIRLLSLRSDILAKLDNTMIVDPDLTLDKLRKGPSRELADWVNMNIAGIEAKLQQIPERNWIDNWLSNCPSEACGVMKTTILPHEETGSNDQDVVLAKDAKDILKVTYLKKDRSGNLKDMTVITFVSRFESIKCIDVSDYSFHKGAAQPKDPQMPQIHFPLRSPNQTVLFRVKPVH